MKKHILFVILVLGPLMVYGQGAGFGYSLDMGGSLWSQGVGEYDQAIGSVTHNVFLRRHSESGLRSFQMMMGYKTEKVSFQNYSTFLSSGGTLAGFNTDATLRRTALRFAMIEQLQFGTPGRIVVALNTGLFYERTLYAERYSAWDDIYYTLDQEVNPHGFGYIFGIETRFHFVTFGYKIEQSFRDVLDHDYILSQDLAIGNSSEMTRQVSTVAISAAIRRIPLFIQVYTRTGSTMLLSRQISRNTILYIRYLLCYIREG